MKKIFPLTFISAVILLLLLGTSTKKTGNDKGLKDYYKNYFTVGVSVSPQALKTDEAVLIIKQFGSITPENAMKMGPVHLF